MFRWWRRTRQPTVGSDEKVVEGVKCHHDGSGSIDERDVDGCSGGGVVFANGGVESVRHEHVVVVIDGDPGGIIEALAVDEGRVDNGAGGRVILAHRVEGGAVDHEELVVAIDGQTGDAVSGSPARDEISVDDRAGGGVILTHCAAAGTGHEEVVVAVQGHEVSAAAEGGDEIGVDRRTGGGIELAHVAQTRAPFRHVVRTSDQQDLPGLGGARQNDAAETDEGDGPSTPGEPPPPPNPDTEPDRGGDQQQRRRFRHGSVEQGPRETEPLAAHERVVHGCAGCGVELADRVAADVGPEHVVIAVEGEPIGGV